MLRRRHRGQQGQVVVLFAVGSVALVAMVGLVLMAGLLFWDQRQLQTFADGAALAGAVQITQTCATSTPVNQADEFLADQLGLSSNLNLGGWACGTAVTDNFGSGYSATYTYPWNSKPYEIAVKITRSGVPLQFGAFIGASQANVTGRAVAQHNFTTLPDTFALFAQNGASCAGSGQQTSSPKTLVNGSVYSGALLNYNGNCAIWAQKTLAFDNTTDYGDILVYSDGQTWTQNNGNCLGGSPGNALCADGFQLSGHLSPTCGNGPGTSPQTEYLNGDTTTNPDPCSGVPPPVPLLQEANYAGTDPNTDSAITNTISGACSASGNPASGRSNDLTNGGNKNYGFGPTPSLDASSVEHFKPGCYGYLDIGTFLKNANPTPAAVTFDAGFYYFNGYHCSLDNQATCTATTGGGLCLNPSAQQSTIVTATDVTMEFVNSTSFSTASCAPSPSSACGGKACDFGTSMFAPGAPSTSTAAVGTSLPAGTYSFEVTYRDAEGETTASPASNVTLSAGGQVTISAAGVPSEATAVGFYLASYSGLGSVNPGYLGSTTVASGSASFTFNSPSLGNYVQPPPTNTATIWFAAPPTSPEPTPTSLTIATQTGVSTNLPAGQYSVGITYADPEGETPVSAAVSTCVTASGQSLNITTPAAPQGVTTVKFYLTGYGACSDGSGGTGSVNTGYIGQVVAPIGSSTSFSLTGAKQGNNGVLPSSNTTSSSWCSASKAGWSATDAAICANQLLWAPPSGMTGGQIGGTFYVKGSNENSALEGDIYWPGPANSTPTSQAAGCNYTANGIGGLLGQVICDSVYVQGGSQAGTATIGYTTGAQYAAPPEISLVE